jgi:hypothetical protein
VSATPVVSSPRLRFFSSQRAVSAASDASLRAGAAALARSFTHTLIIAAFAAFGYLLMQSSARAPIERILSNGVAFNAALLCAALVAASRAAEVLNARFDRVEAALAELLKRRS